MKMSANNMIRKFICFVLATSIFCCLLLPFRTPVRVECAAVKSGIIWSDSTWQNFFKLFDNSKNFTKSKNNYSWYVFMDALKKNVVSDFDKTAYAKNTLNNNYTNRFIVSKGAEPEDPSSTYTNDLRGICYLMCFDLKNSYSGINFKTSLSLKTYDGNTSKCNNASEAIKVLIKEITISCLNENIETKQGMLMTPSLLDSAAKDKSSTSSRRMGKTVYDKIRKDVNPGLVESDFYNAVNEFAKMCFFSQMFTFSSSSGGGSSGGSSGGNLFNAGGVILFDVRGDNVGPQGTAWSITRKPKTVNKTWNTDIKDAIKKFVSDANGFRNFLIAISLVISLTILTINITRLGLNSDNPFKRRQMQVNLLVSMACIALLGSIDTVSLILIDICFR